jgi:hypothetical protein
VSSVRAFKRNRRIGLPANVVIPYYPVLAQRGAVATAVVITNKTTQTIYVAEHDRPDTDYDIAIPPGSSGPMVNPEGIHALYLWCTAAGYFDATEVSTDQPDLQFQVWNMQFTATTPLPIGYNVIGRTIMQNATGDIAGANPLDVTHPADQVVHGHVSVDNLPADQLMHGHVDVDNFPADQLVHTEQWISTLVEATAGNLTQEIKATEGEIARILPLAGVAVTPMDSVASVWAEITAEADFSAAPLKCAGNVRLVFAAPGSAWVQFR